MLDRVALSVSIVIHRIDAPLVTGTMMRRMLDSIKKRIPEHHVRTRHVDLGPEDLLAVSILAVPHLTEKLQVLLHAQLSKTVRNLMPETLIVLVLFLERKKHTVPLVPLHQRLQLRLNADMQLALVSVLYLVPDKDTLLPVLHLVQVNQICTAQVERHQRNIPPHPLTAQLRLAHHQRVHLLCCQRLDVLQRHRLDRIIVIRVKFTAHQPPFLSLSDASDKPSNSSG